MNFNKLKAYFHLSRPVNVFMTFVSIPVACWIAGGTSLPWFAVLFAGTTGALVAAGANAINDVFDIDIDRINRPDRPLPSGALSPVEAKKMWLIVSAAAFGLNLFLNSAALLITVFSIALLYFYSARLKRTVLVGNFAVGLMTGMAFLYGSVVAGKIERGIVPALFAFLVNLARELLKDVEDVKGDRIEKAMTMPVRYGATPSLILATASLLLLIAATMTVAFFHWYSLAFFYIVLAADCLMSVSTILMWLDHSSTSLRRISTLLKISMILGLISIIAGSM